MGVRFQNPTQMHLALDNHMIDALAPDRSDQPFGKAILPRRGRRNGLVPDAVCTENLDPHVMVMKSAKDRV